MRTDLHKKPARHTQSGAGGEVATPNQSSAADGGMRTQLRAADGLAAQRELLAPPPVQLKGAAGSVTAAGVHELAAQGVASGGGAMPHVGQIQQAFGRHSVGDVQAHVGGAAQQAAEGMGALAYASGDHIAFGAQPDLHTAAHEAAHVVQQRGGVQLKDGVGRSGDEYERHADAVADAVVQGKSAEGLLDRYAGSAGTPSVQRRAVQMDGPQVVLAEADEIEVQDVPLLTGDEGTARAQFRDVYAQVDAIVGLGAIDNGLAPQVQREYSASRGTFTGKADRCHRLIAYYHERYDGNRNATDFIPGAQADMVWYEQSAVETDMGASGWAGLFGSMSMSDASWLRLVMYAEQRGMDLTAMEGGRSGERALDEGQASDHAAALGGLVGMSGGNEVLGGSSFQVACSEYHNAWREVGTAYRGTSRKIVEDRAAANELKDDAEESRLAEINGMIQVADTFGAAVSTVMGNMNALQTNVAKWQTTITPLNVQVNDQGAIDIGGGEAAGLTTERTMANLQSYVGPAANAGGEIIRFIYDGEISRCEAAVAAVSAHRSAFQSVVGQNEAIVLAEALQNAMRNLRTKAQAMADQAEEMRRAHMNFGAGVDSRLQAQGQLEEGQESATGYMMEMAAVRECAAYTQNALATADLVEDDGVAMRDRVRHFQDRSHATNDLQRMAGGLDDERDRYDGARLTAWRIKRQLERRSSHLVTMAQMYTGALDGRGSTDGRDSY